MDTPISGHCDPRYASVRDAFEGNFLERGEVGAAVCVMVRGEAVVDLVGGWADEARTQLWRRDTLVNFYSVGKAIVALLALQLVDDGSVGLDDPIASVWPEFAAGGKQRATIREALCHRAGVPAIRERLTDDDLWDWQRMADALAATDPWFEPGSRHIYHTNTYGHLVGEIVRRVTGELPGARLRRLTEPLAADVHWGLTSDQQARCADVIWAPSAPLGAIDPFTIEGDAHLPMLGYFNPPGYSSNGVVNTAEWRACMARSSSRTGCCRPRCSRRPPGFSRKGRARCWVRTSRSASGSYPPPLAGRWARTRAASATSAPEVRWASATPTPACRSAT